MTEPNPTCPCGSTHKLADCCGRYLDGLETAPTAEALMRSRYTAYVLLREDYLLATWRPDTRPVALGLQKEVPTQWIGLTIKHHAQPDEMHASIEFIARYKINGRAHRLHEVSRFIHVDGRWLYIDGAIS